MTMIARNDDDYMQQHTVTRLAVRTHHHPQSTPTMASTTPHQRQRWPAPHPTNANDGQSHTPPTPMMARATPHQRQQWPANNGPPPWLTSTRMNGEHSPSPAPTTAYHHPTNADDGPPHHPQTVMMTHHAQRQQPSTTSHPW